ncbi:hypothetical protein [Paenibacillus sp. 1P07SE]|uniref:hypothetical protein n=1 Tax=Paenibacillus sp. 1P07SE TaxID=3132209 RepID=UPI0039A6E7F2
MNTNSATQTLRDWLYAGPFDLNVSELYQDNYRVPIAPYAELLDEAASRLTGLAPTEGETLSLYDQTLPWSLLRTDESEHKMTWARFGIHARLLVTYAYTRLHAPDDGDYAFGLWLSGSARVMVNGVERFSHQRVGRTEDTFEVRLPLTRGINHIVILLANVHLHCINSFSLTAQDDRIRTEVPRLLEPASRSQLETDWRRFYTAHNVVSGEEQIVLDWDEPIGSTGTFKAMLSASKRGMPLRTVRTIADRLAGDKRTWEIARASELPEAGEYLLSLVYEADTGEQIQGLSFIFERVDWMQDLPQGADFSQRKRYMLEQMAEAPADDRSLLYREYAKMAAGRWDAVDRSAIETAVAYIEDRYDCADFAMHGLLRMYIRYADSGRLDPELAARMKACILGFKYWEDEPGRSLMFTRSENHEILFFSAEYVAGLLFPGDLFTNSGQNGLFHALKGRLASERWIREKGTYGFMEWHSNTYYEEDILALLSIVDFGEEKGYARLLARQLLDLICPIMASHSSRGIMATTHGRSYEESIIHPELEAIGHMNWLLFGWPHRLVRDMSIGCIAMAGSSYSPEPEWEKVAGSESELFTRSQMGLFPGGGMSGVDCSTYRTRDYMVSGMVESKAGEHGGQVHAGQVLLGGTVPVFVTCFDNKSEMTRPSYWGGQYINPHTFAHRNVLAYNYRLGEGPGYTHAYFPFDQFDETEASSGWLFGRLGEAYVALYSQQPYLVMDHGKYKRRELLCRKKNNIWLLEAGSTEQSGSFADFKEAVVSARIQSWDDGALVYDSPSLGEITLQYGKPSRIGGQQLKADDGYPLIDNPHLYGEYGTGIVTLWLPGGRKKLNFNI